MLPPCGKVTEQGKRRICCNYICFIAQDLYFITAKIAITFQVFPLQIIYINSSRFVSVTFKRKNSTMRTGLLFIVLR